MEYVVITGAGRQGTRHRFLRRVCTGAVGVCVALHGGLGADRGHQRGRRAHPAARGAHDQVLVDLQLGTVMEAGHSRQYPPQNLE